MTAPVLFARLYPVGRSGLYYEFRVWESLRDMRAHFTWGKVDPRARGFASTYETIRPDGRVSPRCGEINVLRKGLGIEILTHEVTHAALGWARRKGVDVTDQKLARSGRTFALDSGEEQLCYAIGWMTSQAVRALNRSKIWP